MWHQWFRKHSLRHIKLFNVFIILDKKSPKNNYRKKFEEGILKLKATIKDRYCQLNQSRKFDLTVKCHTHRKPTGLSVTVVDLYVNKVSVLLYNQDITLKNNANVFC